MFPYDPVHQTFVNVYDEGTLRHQAILDASRHAVDYYAGTWQGTAAVLGVFIPAGIDHILIGPDHILFLVGLLLLGGSFGTLVTIVTAFTIGHSITLSLAALDIVSPPASIVEPAIALSIVFVGADNLLVLKDLGAPPQRRNDEASAGYQGVGRGGVWIGARLRLRERAEGIRPADHGARLVAVLVQCRRRNRPAGHRADRRRRCSPRFAAGARRRAAGS